MNDLIRQSKYLVCVDDTEVSCMALRFACIKARKRHILIDIMHVIPPSDIQALGGVAEKMRAEQRAEAETFLQELSQIAFELSGVMPTLWIREGDPSQEILDLALSQPDINMLVMGINPSSKSGNRVISWITSKAGEKLLVPVMLVPSTLTDQQMHQLA